MYSISYLTDAIREDGLDVQLSAVGNINDLTDALLHMETAVGTANFKRDFEMNRRAVLMRAINFIRDAKNAGAVVGQTMDNVSRTIVGLRIGGSVAMIILFISFFIGIGTGSFIAAIIAAIIMGGAAWYFWPYIRLFMSSSQHRGMI